MKSVLAYHEDIITHNTRQNRGHMLVVPPLWMFSVKNYSSVRRFLAIHDASETSHVSSSVEHATRHVKSSWLVHYMHANGASFLYWCMLIFLEVLYNFILEYILKGFILVDIYIYISYAFI